MRVVHVTHSQEAGGAEYALTRVVGQRLWPAQIVVPHPAAGARAFFDGARSSGADVRMLGRPMSPRASSPGLVGLAGLVSSLVQQAVRLRFSSSFRGSSVVYANTTRAAAYSVIAALVSRKTFVVHLRDMVDRQAMGAFGVAATRMALLRADGIVANSRATLDSVPKRYRRATPVAVIPSPIGLDVAMPTPPESDGDVRIVGMVARIDPWKGQAELLEAFADVFAGSQVELRLVGGPAFGHGDYLHRLEERVEALGLRDQVVFTGHVEDVWAEVRRFDLAVHAAQRPEPLGQNLLQYLACRVPLIAARAGGPLEWVVEGENGLLFDAEDRGALSAALHRLASDRTLRSSMRRQTTAALPPTDAVVAQRTREFLVQVAEKRRR